MTIKQYGYSGGGALADYRGARGAPAPLYQLGWLYATTTTTTTSSRNQ